MVRGAILFAVGMRRRVRSHGLGILSLWACATQALDAGSFLCVLVGCRLAFLLCSELRRSQQPSDRHLPRPIGNLGRPPRAGCSGMSNLTGAMGSRVMDHLSMIANFSVDRMAGPVWLCRFGSHSRASHHSPLHSRVTQKHKIMKLGYIVLVAISSFMLAGCASAPETVDIAVRSGISRNALRLHSGEPLRIDPAASGGEDWYYRFLA